MIVRAILNDPEKICKNFDYFNDYKDTMQWLKNLSNSEEKITAIFILSSSHLESIE